MGFSCPVCGDPQADGVHLANHLAITALTRGGAHEAWLDEQVPEWETLDEEELGERVRDLAADTEYPQVFEDTTDDGHNSHDHQEGRSGESLPPGAEMLPDELDEDTEAVIREAMEMTRERSGAVEERAQSGESEKQPDNSETE